MEQLNEKGRWEVNLGAELFNSPVFFALPVTICLVATLSICGLENRNAARHAVVPNPAALVELNGLLEACVGIGEACLRPAG